MPLHKVLQAVYLMTSSKMGVSAHQLHRRLEITYKSAWFLAHRIREAMREGKLSGGMGEGRQARIVAHPRKRRLDRLLENLFLSAD